MVSVLSLCKPPVLLTSQETVKLYEELKVYIVTLRRLAVSAAHMMGVQIDTCN
jgi:hypothetical protein